MIHHQNQSNQITRGKSIQIVALTKMFTTNRRQQAEATERKINTNAHSHLRSVLTMDLTLSFFRSVYDCPQPTNMTGAPDT